MKFGLWLIPIILVCLLQLFYQTILIKKIVSNSGTLFVDDIFSDENEHYDDDDDKLDGHRGEENVLLNKYEANDDGDANDDDSIDASEEDTDDRNIITTKKEKPKLFMHVGPLKTGTTSIQLNVLRNKQMKDIHLPSDGYQLFFIKYRKWNSVLESCLNQDMDLYRKFNLVRESCLNQDMDPASYDCRNWYSVVHHSFKEAYEKMLISSPTSSPVQGTIHSQEGWSVLPKNNITYSLLKELFVDWDVTFIIMYRPLVDWIPSIYAQMRKYTIRDVRRYFDHYLPTDKPLMPEYISNMRITNGDTLRDSLGTYEYYKEFLVNIMDEPNPDEKIIIHHSYTSRGLEQDFICTLPHTEKSCNVVKNKTFRNINSSAKLPLDVDLILREAFDQKLISVGRNIARKNLEIQMKAKNITLQNLPKHCITKEDKDWILSRALVSAKLFDSDSVTNTTEFHERFDKVLNEKYCIVDAVASLKMNSFRVLFDDCMFQSPYLLDERLNEIVPKRLNPKWENLNCNNNTM